MVLSSLSFAIMGAAVKYLGNIPVTEKVFVRNIISLFVALYLSKGSLKSILGETSKGRRLLVLRSTLGLSGVILIFFAISHLSLADSALFMRLSPFWVAIFASIFLGEKLTKGKIVLLAIALLGAVLVIRPQFDYKVLPAIAGLLASIAAGAAYTTVSKLRKYEKPETIVFFFSLFSIIAMVPFVIISGLIPTFYEFLGLIITGLGAAGGQMALTYSYRLGKASEVSIFNYLGIIFSVIIGLVMFNEIPDIITIVGGLLIFSAGFFMYKFGKERA